MDETAAAASTDSPEQPATAPADAPVDSSDPAADETASSAPAPAPEQPAPALAEAPVDEPKPAAQEIAASAPAEAPAEAAPASTDPAPLVEAPVKKRGKAEAKPEEDAEAAPVSPQEAFKIVLPAFEGPLDLLLHLIREHRVDIFDIPISLITEKYLQALKAMKELNLDIAGEFILMAATLAHIKSRMLLPNPEEQPGADEEQSDPREELVKRLLEYQKYKAAGEELGRADLLDREVFTRRARLDQIPLGDGEVGLVEVSVFKLVEALDATLRNAKIHVPHQVMFDRISLGDAISSLVERLKTEPRTSFHTVLGEVADRQKIVVTFLALLEMCKLGLIRVYQEEGQEDILISAKDPESLQPAEIKDDYK
ncbi:MAG TPA: segregation/condensation protein A [Myxococcales bacterium]